MIADIYIETTWKRPFKQKGFIAFVIVVRYDGPPDFTDKLYCEQKEPITMFEALLRGTAAAVDRAANMPRLKGCHEFNLICSNPWVGNMYKELDTWKKNGWKNSKGKEVEHKEYWMMIEKAAQGRKLNWIPERTKESGLDGYQDWLLRTLKMR